MSGEVSSWASVGEASILKGCDFPIRLSIACDYDSNEDEKV